MFKNRAEMDSTAKINRCCMFKSPYSYVHVVDGAAEVNWNWMFKSPYSHVPAVDGTAEVNRD
jgi:hypothetical protein